MRVRLVAPVLVMLIAAACGSSGAPAPTPAVDASTEPVDGFGTPFPPAPAVPQGPLDATVIADLETVFADPASDIDLEALERLGQAGDPRVAWLMSDLLRFFQFGPVAEAAETAFEELTGSDVADDAFAWVEVTDRLIAWDLPAPPGYDQWKRRMFDAIEPGWSPFFEDDDADVDWRWLSWGGVLIDARPLGSLDTCPRGCIPALDDPATTVAADGDWYGDDEFVFGVIVNGEARAYPKHIMEVHELVNDTLGGRRIGVPYCTLCGSAQAYFTDVASRATPLVLRTSGLLSRSNKVMFDLTTYSLFDTFSGRALSGPLQGLELEMVTVRTSTWGDWKDAHPNTTIVARDGGVGRAYDLDPLQGRDDGGPIFPIGDVDPRLRVQEPVLGVITPDGVAVAFPVTAARTALDEGREVTLAGVTVVTDGAGLSANVAGMPLASHQAFWFAWSQFHPTTVVWTPLGDG
jgi:hypothetical protein